ALFVKKESLEQNNILQITDKIQDSQSETWMKMNFKDFRVLKLKAKIEKVSIEFFKGHMDSPLPSIIDTDSIVNQKLKVGDEQSRSLYILATDPATKVQIKIDLENRQIYTLDENGKVQMDENGNEISRALIDDFTYRQLFMEYSEITFVDPAKNKKLEKVFEKLSGVIDNLGSNLDELSLKVTKNEGDIPDFTKVGDRITLNDLMSILNNKQYLKQFVGEDSKIQLDDNFNGLQISLQQNKNYEYFILSITKLMKSFAWINQFQTFYSGKSKFMPNNMVQRIEFLQKNLHIDNKLNNFRSVTRAKSMIAITRFYYNFFKNFESSSGQIKYSGFADLPSQLFKINLIEHKIIDEFVAIDGVSNVQDLSENSKNHLFDLHSKLNNFQSEISKIYEEKSMLPPIKLNNFYDLIKEKYENLIKSLFDDTIPNTFIFQNKLLWQLNFPYSSNILGIAKAIEEIRTSYPSVAGMCKKHVLLKLNTPIVNQIGQIYTSEFYSFTESRFESINSLNNAYSEVGNTKSITIFEIMAYLNTLNDYLDIFRNIPGFENDKLEDMVNGYLQALLNNKNFLIHGQQQYPDGHLVHYYDEETPDIVEPIMNKDKYHFDLSIFKFSLGGVPLILQYSKDLGTWNFIVDNNEKIHLKSEFKQILLSDRISKFNRKMSQSFYKSASDDPLHALWKFREFIHKEIMVGLKNFDYKFKAEHYCAIVDKTTANSKIKYLVDTQTKKELKLLQLFMKMFKPDSKIYLVPKGGKVSFIGGETVAHNAFALEDGLWKKGVRDITDYSFNTDKKKGIIFDGMICLVDQKNHQITNLRSDTSLFLELLDYGTSDRKYVRKKNWDTLRTTMGGLPYLGICRSTYKEHSDGSITNFAPASQMLAYDYMVTNFHPRFNLSPARQIPLFASKAQVGSRTRNIYQSDTPRNMQGWMQIPQIMGKFLPILTMSQIMVVARVITSQTLTYNGEHMHDLSFETIICHLDEILSSSDNLDHINEEGIFTDFEDRWYHMDGTNLVLGDLPTSQADYVHEAELIMEQMGIQDHQVASGSFTIKRYLELSDLGYTDSNGKNHPASWHFTENLLPITIDMRVFWANIRLASLDLTTEERGALEIARKEALREMLTDIHDTTPYAYNVLVDIWDIPKNLDDDNQWQEWTPENFLNSIM
ncbi:MAG: hypothetical protein ACTSW3_08725, partial [Promethearchaeota archaeon]